MREPSTFAELVEKWRAYRDVYARHEAQVAATGLIDELLGDLAAVHASNASDAVTLAEAARIGGYSVDHLQRLAASGKIENVGRRGSPRIRRGDVPTKPGRALRNGDESDELSARRRMARSVITHELGACE